jgi:hypothetical protein
MDMKKLFLLLIILPLFLSLAGCDFFGAPWLTPPVWIIGTWSGYFTTDSYRFQFNTNNVILYIQDVPRDFRQTYIGVSDRSNTTQYTIDGTELDGSSTTYTFTKISDTIVYCEIDANWVSIPLMVLSKQ